MSTLIATIEGSCHYYPIVSTQQNPKGYGEIKHGSAELHLTRFFNGKDKGANIQLTVCQLTVCQSGEHGTSYIHLTKDQCNKLAKILLECFDYDKYPSE